MTSRAREDILAAGVPGGREKTKGPHPLEGWGAKRGRRHQPRTREEEPNVAVFIPTRDDVDVDGLGRGLRRRFKGEKHETCRIATLNVNSLKHKIEEVTTIMKEHDIHILCLQEIKMEEGDLRVMASKVWKEDKIKFAYNCGYLEGNAHQAGVAILSKWPTTTYSEHEIVRESEAIGRVVTTAVHCPGKTPINLANVYLRPSAPTHAQRLGTKVMHNITTGEDQAIVIGDFNTVKEEPWMSQMLLSGRWRDADQALQRGTRRNPDGTMGRQIDYMVHTKDILIRTRDQVDGVADHDMVIYEVEVDKMKGWRTKANRRTLRNDGRDVAP